LADLGKHDAPRRASTRKRRRQRSPGRTVASRSMPLGRTLEPVPVWFQSRSSILTRAGDWSRRVDAAAPSGRTIRRAVLVRMRFRRPDRRPNLPPAARRGRISAGLSCRFARCAASASRGGFRGPRRIGDFAAGQSGLARSPARFSPQTVKDRVADPRPRSVDPRRGLAPCGNESADQAHALAGSTA
jgi:hypothetical protein